MKFIIISTWEPHQRDKYAQKRLEKGRMTPEGIKVLSEWLDTSGGRQVVLMEADSALECYNWSNHWNDLAKFESFAVVEVKDDMLTQVEE